MVVSDIVSVFTIKINVGEILAGLMFVNGCSLRISILIMSIFDEYNLFVSY